MPSRTHIMSDETGRRIATALESMTGSRALEWDEGAECYTNDSIKRMFDAASEGLPYGVQIPKGSATQCVKTGANAGVANPVPGVIGRPCIDPYVGRGPFRFVLANGVVLEDGSFKATAIQGDGRFSLTSADVWVLTPVLYWSYTEAAETVEIGVSDTRLPGMAAQPGAYLPSGDMRPYIAYAKYAMSKGENNTPRSVSGAPVWNRGVSHNHLITICKTATTGYSGRSVADDWYLKVMYVLKYGTKNSAANLAGCFQYDVRIVPTVDLTATRRFVCSNVDAAKLVVGSSVMVGSGPTPVDRGQAAAYNVCDATKILSITPYDAGNMAVELALGSAVDIGTANCVQTAPWNAGSCDSVEGDGSPTNPLSGKEPFVLQGIETMVGVLEVTGDVILKNDGTTGWVPYVCWDSRNEANTVTANYTPYAALPTDEFDSHKYPYYPANSNGLLYGTAKGASTTTGLCDSHYTNKMETTGEREWLSLGYLYNGAGAGLWYLLANSGVGYAGWSIGSRLSSTGRTRG